MKLIVCNELSSAESNKYLNSDTLKSIITETKIDINEKGMPVRKAENVANLIFVSNNFDPIRITKNDRRYVMMEVSDKYRGNHAYFKKLCGGFDEEFYDNLYTYFMKRDIKDFDVTDVPITKTKEEVLEITKSSYELFYERNEDKFNEGWQCSDAYQSYRFFAQNNGFANCSVTTFRKNIKTFVDRRKKAVDGERKWYYYSKNAEEDN